MPAVLAIPLDRGSGTPLYVQIAAAIRASIEAGEMPAGSRQPSSRANAEELTVQRNTGVQAFSLLREEGWLSAGVGQGTFVRSPLLERKEPLFSGGSDDSRISADGAGLDPDRFSWESVLPSAEQSNDLWQYWLRDSGEGDAIRFTGATADPAHFPVSEFQAILDEVLHAAGSRALDYGPAAGYPPLRDWLADRLSHRGIDADGERLIIVNGSQQALDLIARLLVREGDRVLVEEPSYSNGFRLLQAHGAEVDTVRIDAGGIEVDSLERACRKGRAQLLYTMPLFQNPTGMVLEEDRIDPILSICRRHRVPIVEDHFDAELVYEGEPPVPIAARDRWGQVILIGSFSKILFPGLRLGWMLVPRLLLRMVQDLKQLADLSTGLLSQQAMDLYCRRGLLDEHLVRVRKINGKRLSVMLESMEKEFPSDVAWTRPRGGMTVWVQLPAGVDSLALLESVRRNGVEFSPGPFFFPNGGGSGFLRLCCVRETEERIRRGIRILGDAIREHVSRASANVTPRPFL